ncbi:hypothetical protein DSO57_1004527 [Entomophthora muscae]|uniref:Uncharacterized protein n=1 Tax=Entomophthora muscae TaxID=34485 RepID=A0ACC2RN46_9FUNG|nr:hypothetical protein DSO57_1004527 [Entomophthora muscae]
MLAEIAIALVGIEVLAVAVDNVALAVGAICFLVGHLRMALCHRKASLERTLRNLSHGNRQATPKRKEGLFKLHWESPQRYLIDSPQ